MRYLPLSLKCHAFLLEYVTVLNYSRCLSHIMPLTLNQITLTETTLTNHKAIEYQWVRTLYIQGYPPNEINHYIQTCFGGDKTFADLFRRVAIYEESLYLLLQYLNCAPSSREF